MNAPLLARDWLREGLRASVFLRPRVAGAQPTPAQLLVPVALVLGLELLLARLQVPGGAHFDLRGWLAPWWAQAATLLLVWAVLWGVPRDDAADRPAGLASWVALSFAASLPVLVAGHAVGIAEAYGVWPRVLQDEPVLAWGVFLLLSLWAVAIPIRLGAAFGLRARRLAALGTGLAVLYAVGTWQFQDSPWEPLREAHAERPRLALSQELFERQQALWDTLPAALAAQRPGVTDVYGLVFAPVASEDVFLRESALVAEVLASRFDAQDRVLQLVNHATTATTLPWATPANLRRAVDAIAARMDREEDVLVVYLTSHGGGDFQLSAEHWPLEVQGLKPSDLRAALDQAGIRNRVLMVSACYSGGWIDPLADPGTLVMTAADATHTSYGCGRRSPLTFFGRALFDEQLRRTHSFEDAFAAAVPVIRQREVEAGKPDGFSNPQIRVGEAIRPVLAGLARRLDAGTDAAR